MKWNASTFLENRIFDRRLVKDNLIDKWNIYGDIYKQRSDYRQFLDTYVNQDVWRLFFYFFGVVFRVFIVDFSLFVIFVWF